ncbi:MAG: globin-coupled sensor protein [Halorientalis sp.]
MASTDEYKITDETRQQVDGSVLCAEIGIDDEEIEWRKSFTRFDEADRRRLSNLETTFESVADDLVDEFYDHIVAHDKASSFLDMSTKTVEMLQQSQRGYLTDLPTGEYGTKYFERRARIGKIHDMLDLGPRIYLGAYSVYYEGLVEAIAEEVKSELLTADGGTAVASGETDGTGLTPTEAIDTTAERILSTLKLLTLDQQVAMDTYIYSYSQRMEDEIDRRTAVSKDVESAVKECQSKAETVANKSGQISEVASAQTDNMEAIASEVANLSATIEEVASTADRVDATSDEAERLAKDGQESADQAIDAMENVSTSADTVAADVDRLQERVDEIDGIVEVINDIADQTNILALNASIEAARAGEAGEGFAVVADEVKQLAEQSQEHANQIDEMISNIQTDTEETVESLERTTVQVDDGIEQVETAMERLVEIAESVQTVSQGVQEVAAATDDQAASTEEVASMVDETVDRVHEFADSISDIAAANEKQRSKVEDINESVSRLTETNH